MPDSDTWHDLARFVFAKLKALANRGKVLQALADRRKVAERVNVSVCFDRDIHTDLEKVEKKVEKGRSKRGRGLVVLVNYGS